MKKIILFLILSTFLISCADESKRMEFLQAKYKNYKVEPATGLIKERGYDFIIIDSNQQIISIQFYPFSETKILNFRNVR